MPAPIPDDARLRAYVRRSLVRGLVSLVLLFVGVGVVSVVYRPELFAFTKWTYDAIGWPGLVAILVVSDVLTSPVPPQLVLLVIANSPLHAERYWLVPALSLLSAACGTCAYLLAIRFGHTRTGTLLLGRFRAENRAMIDRWGTLGLVLCALTPIPYSISCWAAGALHVRPRSFAWVPLLRIPRVVLYYVVVASAGRVLGGLF